MKTYEETARDVLTRRDEYEKTRKRRIRTLAASLSSFAVVAVIAVGVMVSGAKRDDVTVAAGDNTNDPIPTGTYSETEKPIGDADEQNDFSVITPSADVNDDFSGDSIGRLFIDGTEYLQVEAGGVDGDVRSMFMLGEYLGRAEDFDGIYKELYEKDGISGEVYRINWENADIAILLSNGGFVTLRAVEK